MVLSLICFVFFLSIAYVSRGKATFADLEQSRAYKAPRAPSVSHPGTSSLSPTHPSVTYTFDDRGAMVPDVDRDNR